MDFIVYKNVSKSFGKKRVLDRVNLSIRKGETMTILGGSGSGKTVLLKAFLRLLNIDSGQILFEGEDIVQMGEDVLTALRRRVGMVFQGGALFDSLSVAENIAYPLREHFDKSEEEIRDIVKTKLELVGLPGIEESYPADLSGGMKKRVALARTIATDPEVVLYDEPTTGLDPINTTRIDNLIRSIQEKMKVTSIVVTHDMDSAFRISDRLAFLYKGKIEALGTKDEIQQSDNALIRSFITGEIPDERARRSF